MAAMLPWCLVVVMCLSAFSGVARAVTGPRPGSSADHGDPSDPTDPRDTPDTRPGLTLADGTAARRHVRVATAPPIAPDGARARVTDSIHAAWRAFTSELGRGWHALWDADTGVPLRIIGPGHPAPGSAKSAHVAERIARRMLARHVALLAPGSRAEDFELASNHRFGRVRTVGFVQHHRGVRVLGGQLSFRFAGDRLVAIASEALPAVRVPNPSDAAEPGDATRAYRDVAAAVVIGPALARARATAWLGASGASGATAGAVDGPFVLPVIRASKRPAAGQPVAYHLVVRVDVATRAPLGRFAVYLDAHTGAPIAREQTLAFATGELRYAVPVQHPGGPRAAYPARLANLSLTSAGGAGSDVSDGLGQVTWPGTGEASAIVTTTGPRVRVVSQTGAAARAVHSLTAGGSALWDASDQELLDAQITAFVHLQLGLDRARELTPELTLWDDTLTAYVNIDAICNAFSNGEEVYFMLASPQCQNSARLADVLYHELGHVMHKHAAVPGTGGYEPALSEGVSDYFAATITNQPRLGIGFFYDDTPLRDLDPPGREYRWPDDVGGLHATGLIFAGAMWDLRAHLVATYGDAAGEALADELFGAVLRRATSVPAAYVELLVADDDDGDLSNGTPNECAIREIFGHRIGLGGLGVDRAPLSVEPPERDGYRVSLALPGLGARCPGDAVAAATLYWGVRNSYIAAPFGGDEPLAENPLPLVIDGDALTADIPRQPDGALVRYRVEVELTDGTRWSFPANPADTAYELYVGDVVPLYCTGFETNPLTEGWIHGKRSAVRDRDEWEWGAPQNHAAGFDPEAAHGGERVFGTDVNEGDDGLYQDTVVGYADTPAIGVGRYSDVRLQYWRWLTVEDAALDQATIYANGELAWRNRETEAGDRNHIDREWVFHDVPLSPFLTGAPGESVTLSFELVSDYVGALGGWTLDDLCVVARPDAVCGDGVVSGAEQCDDGAGNADRAADSCRTSCRLARCGDGVRDDDEQCDDGNADDGDGCTAACMAEPAVPAGCAMSAGSGASSPASIAFVLIALGIAARRRVRRRWPRRTACDRAGVIRTPAGT